MHPILVKICGIPLYSYGLMLAIAFLVCVMLALRKAVSIGIAPHHILDLSLYILVSGIMGARVLYIATNLSYYIEHPFDIFLLQKGGLSFYGGFGLALIVGFFVAKRRKLPLGKVSDLIILYLPLGHAIARIGCFLNGCCYGKPTSVLWAVQFPPYSLAARHFGTNHLVHPVQLYSSLMNLGIFLALSLSRKRFDGELVFKYMILYGAGRFILELFRGDNPVVLFGLNIFQLISIGILILGLILKPVIEKHARNSL